MARHKNESVEERRRRFIREHEYDLNIVLGRERNSPPDDAPSQADPREKSHHDRESPE